MWSVSSPHIAGGGGRVSVVSVQSSHSGGGGQCGQCPVLT